MTVSNTGDTSLGLFDGDQSTDRDGTTWSAFFGGDCIVSDTAGDSRFSPSLRRRMQEADLSVVNLEGPLEGAGEPLTKFGPVKRSADDAATVLANAGIDAVTLANNHAMDYGPEGLFETMATCRESGVGVCGAGVDVSAALTPHREAVADGNVSVALIGLCEREFGIATETDPGTAWVNHPEVFRRVTAAADAADLVIVFAHGGIEYVPLPPTNRQKLLRSLVDAGADLVVGHHPHVAQGWERADGGAIFYSLGNFLFYQSSRPNTQRGIALEIEFRESTPVDVELVPIELTDGVVREIPDSENRRDFLCHLHRLSRITGDEDALRVHWQELAERIFLQRYSSWLRRTAGGDPVTMVRQPDLHVQQDGLWDSERRQSEMLLLLNLFQNESHRAVVETALGVRTGVQTDERTGEVRRTVRELLSWTEDRPVYDPPSASRRRVQMLLDRLAP